MDKKERIKIAITSGIAAVILLILVLFLALSEKKTDDGRELEENIAEYSSSNEASSEKSDEAVAASMETSEKEASEDGSSKDSSSQDSSALTLTDSKTKGAVSGNSFYPTTTATLKNVYRNVSYNTQSQLYEMYEYWFQSNMDAVRDLAHLERFEAMSYSLTGSNDYYYYGETDEEGNPDGKGLAVYANSQYYYGYWSQGKRWGTGTWISFYPNYSTNVVKEHMYNGEWADDLPDGTGQEHLDYRMEYMNTEDIYLQNAIGGYSQGKYNGDMYVITLEINSNTVEWDGVCDHGDWEEVPYASHDDKGRIPVLSGREDKEAHIYMTNEGARNNGVSGIIPSGSKR